jgi:hypothetical protein
MISQYFKAAFCPMRHAVRLWFVFPVPADVRDMCESHDHRERLCERLFCELACLAANLNGRITSAATFRKKWLVFYGR